MLQKQTVSVSFAQGVDTKTDPKQVIQGKLLRLENGMFINPLRINKRAGNSKIGDVSSGLGIASYQDELIAFDGSTVESLSESNSVFENKGKITSVEARLESIISNDYQQLSQSVAYHSIGMKAFVWEDGRGGVRYSIIDSSTGNSIINDAVLDASGSLPRVFAHGNYFVFLYYAGSTNLKYKYSSVNTPLTLSSAVTVISTIHSTNTIYQAVIIGSRLFIVWNSSAGGGSVDAIYVTSTLVASASLAHATEVATGGIAIWGDSYNQVYVAYYNGSKIRSFVADYNLGSNIANATDIVTAANIRNLTGIMTSETSQSVGTATLLYEVSAASAINYFTRSVTIGRSSGTLTPGTPADFLRSVGLVSNLFEYNDVNYVTVAFESTVQPTYFVVNLSGLVVARIAQETGGGHTAKSLLPDVWSLGSGQFLLSILQKTHLTVSSGVLYSVLGVVESILDFESENTYLNANMSDSLHVNGGIVWMYDGASMVEHGFHLFPEQAAAPSTSSTGGSMSNGTYSYSIVYAWTDNRGNIHRSAPSIPQSVVLSGGTSTQKVIWALPTLRVTMKQSGFSRATAIIEVYRTVASGTIYYKVTSTSAPTVNSVTADTVSFEDTVSDASLVGNELLYTTGGVLENIPAPPAKLITTFKTRIVVVPSENDETFWLSKTISPGSPVEFSDSLERTIDARDGGITGISQMDEKLILFKLNTAWATTGVGPDNTGGQDDMPTPELITTDAGCTNPRSIVVTPAGLMRQTAKGIYLLNRSLQDGYIGAEVEEFNDQVITSAQLIPNTNQVRFTTVEGTTLVYDYLFSQWSTYTAQDAVDSTVFQSLFTWIDSDGAVFQETPNSFTDDGAFVPLRVTTGWLSFAGLQGFQRVWQAIFLGEYKSPHRLIIRMAYDFNPNPIQEAIIDAGDLLDNGEYGDDSPYGAGSPYGGEFPLEQFRVFMTKQKCEAIQIDIQEVQDSDFGEGLSLSALNFVVGVKSGTFKVNPSRSFG